MMCACGADADLVLHIFRQLFKEMRIQMIDDTLQPETISPALNHVASFDALHPKNKAGYRRFSVAVWRNRDSQNKEAMYWVGVELYWSAPVEFFDYHFTDDIYYHNEWKKSVAPECRGK